MDAQYAGRWNRCASRIAYRCLSNSIDGLRQCANVHKISQAKLDPTGALQI